MAKASIFRSSSRSRPAIAIAQFALLEAFRNRLLWLAGAFLLAGFVLAEFVAEVAIAEVNEFQSAFMASVLRLSAVFIVSLFVTTSMVRDFNDKVLELILAAAVPRASYFLGKLAGYCCVALAIATMYGVTTLLYAPGKAALIWSASLWCELSIVVTMCLLTLFTFGQVTAALGTVFAFYVLARSIAAIAFMSDSPLLTSSSVAQQFLGWVIDAIAFALPSFHRFTASEWLVYPVETDWSDLLPVIGQTAIYLPLLAAAALYDLYRKNL